MLQQTDRYGEKRSWNSLHGSWGKRNSEDDAVEVDDVDDAQWYALKKRSWGKLHGAWGKRFRSDAVPYVDSDVELFQPILMSDKRSWSQLHGAWGKRMPVVKVSLMGCLYAVQTAIGVVQVGSMSY